MAEKKRYETNAFILFFWTVIAQGCTDHSITAQICYQGVVIGKIRSWGGGIAVSMTESTFSTHQWRGYKNVIEAFNIPHGHFKSGEKIYFTARIGTEQEQVSAMSADGDESDICSSSIIN